MRTRLQSCTVGMFVLFFVIASTITEAQQVPILSWPVGNVNYTWTGMVTLNWYNNDGPTYTYRVQVSTAAANFATTVFDSSNITTTNVITTTLPNGSYLWRVKGTTPNTDFSQPAAFQISGQGPATYTITITNAGTGSGTVSRSLPGPNYNAGDVVTLTANPAVESTFTGWSGSDGSGTGILTLTMNSDKVVTANFSAPVPPGNYTLTVNSNPAAGGFTLPTGTSVQPSGSTVLISAEPNAGYEFVNWSGDVLGSATSSSNSVLMSTDKTITANFELIPVPDNTYYVDASNPNTGDGSISDPFQDLRDAVAASVASGDDGNIISVAEGEYNYFVTVNDANLSIIGESATVKRFAVTSDNVSISGFTVTNTTAGGAGINAIGISGLSLEDINAVGNSSYGLYLVNCSDVNVTNSSFSGNGLGTTDLYGGVYLESCSNVSFENVEANENDQDGFIFKLLSNGTFTDLTASMNDNYGLNLNESSNISFVGGTFFKNLDGMHIHPHADADVNMQDTIKGLTFSGTVVVDSNSRYGINLLTDASTVIKNPVFNGSFHLKGNGAGALLLAGNVRNPEFYGFDFYGSSFGVRIHGLAGSTNQPQGVKINYSTFKNFGTAPTNLAISLSDYVSRYSTNNVDANKNQWLGLNNSTDIDNRIHDKLDDTDLGLVSYNTNYGFGTSTITIGGGTITTAGESITLPVNLNIYTTVSYNTLSGIIRYDSTQLKLASVNIGTGTIINDMGWPMPFTVQADDPGNNSLKRITFNAGGVGAITAGGELFNLTFTSVATTSGTTSVAGLTSEWKANNVASVFIINNGTVTFTIPVQPSALRGDANLDTDVDLDDALTVETHLLTPFLEDQAAINADASLDEEITALDISYIMYFVINGGWPIYLPPTESTGGLTFADLNYGADGMINIPVAITSSQKVRSLEVLFSYDKSLIDYQTFAQQLLSMGNIVSAREIEPGKSLFVFATANDLKGEINPGKISLKFKDGSPVAGSKIQTMYRINNSEFAEGPSLNLSITGIEQESAEGSIIPDKFEVSQNYPNPFNPTTIIKYGLPEASFVTIRVYNMLGEEVTSLVNEEKNAGTYSVQWNGTNSLGQKVSSGAYLYRISAGSNVVTKKMLLIK